MHSRQRICRNSPRSDQPETTDDPTCFGRHQRRRPRQGLLRSADAADRFPGSEIVVEVRPLRRLGQRLQPRNAGGRPSGKCRQRRARRLPGARPGNRAALSPDRDRERRDGRRRTGSASTVQRELLRRLCSRPRRQQDRSRDLYGAGELWPLTALTVPTCPAPDPCPAMLLPGWSGTANEVMVGCRSRQLQTTTTKRNPPLMSEQIRSWLSSQREPMLKLMERVVNIDSGSYDKAGVDAVGEAFAEFIASHDIEVERFPRDISGDIFRARIPGPGNAPVVLMGHRDTVFPKGEAARRPFSIKDGRAYGPGVCDMKGGLVLNAFVLAAFKKFGGNTAPLVALLTSDEEIGSPQSRGIIEETAQGARAVYNSEPGRANGNVVR